MEIVIKWFDGKWPTFNIELATKAGNDPFITIKGCSLREHNGKEFIGFPSKKMESGKYWSHVFASDDFQRVIIEKAKVGMPKHEKEASKASNQDVKGSFDNSDSNIPF